MCRFLEVISEPLERPHAVLSGENKHIQICEIQIFFFFFHDEAGKLMQRPFYPF